MLDQLCDEADDHEVLRSAIQESRLWVAVDAADAVVGLALAVWCGDDAHLQELDVLPNWGRRGIGRRLVAEVIAWAGRNHRERLTLTTFAEIPWNAPFYARLGFSVLPGGSWTDAHRVVWEHEREMGLPMEERVVMARPSGEGPTSDGSG